MKIIYGIRDYRKLQPNEITFYVIPSFVLVKSIDGRYKYANAIKLNFMFWGIGLIFYKKK